MRTDLIRLMLSAAAICAAAAPAGAQTLYKLIDRNGKVTYVETPPRDFDGKVIRLDIDPKANTATLPKPTEPLAAPAAGAEREQVRAARAKVETARKALAQARDNPGEGDLARVGKKGGGTRPVPTEDYQKRLAELERQVKDAEEELSRVERR